MHMPHSFMKLKPFQKFDMARLALASGAICGWSTGLGKSWAAYIFCLLKVGWTKKDRLTPKAPCLLVVPGDLHQQISDEGDRFFKSDTVKLDSQEAFDRLSTQHPHLAQRELPPRFYLTSYTQLANNGVAKMPAIETMRTENHAGDVSPMGMLAMLHLGLDHAEQFFNERAEHLDRQYADFGVTAADTLMIVTHAYDNLRRQYCESPQTLLAIDKAWWVLKNFAGPKPGFTFNDLEPAQRHGVVAEFCRRKHAEYSAAVGETRTRQKKDAEGKAIGPKLRVKCCYSPSLADLCQDTFKAVVIDEGVKIKGMDTIVGRGVRQMNPEFRLVLSATPVKNRLPDIFPLLHWASGGHEEAHPRFPYKLEDIEEFADTFMLTEQNLSKEDARAKRSPQVCNIHKIWKLFGPNILRRRKDDIGEAIVEKVRHVVRVPMGKHQAETYGYHLRARYRDCNGMPAPGAQLQALRMVSCAPHCENLHGINHTCCPPCEKEGKLSCNHYRSEHPYIPKLASALTLIEQVLAKREQVVVFSAFHEPLDTLSLRLQEAGVRHLLLDGRTSPAKRGKLSAAFKLGPPGSGGDGERYPVMLAGVDSMAEGHSWHLCGNAILLSYSWAYDKFEQAINRIHRLTSAKDVNVWSLICNGSIDRQQEEDIQTKGDAAELVLDGHLFGENPSEVNLAELLQIAAREFDPNSQTLDEEVIAGEWPELRGKLAGAMRRWDAPAPVVNQRIIEPVSEPIPNPLQLTNSMIHNLPLWRQKFGRPVRQAA